MGTHIKSKGSFLSIHHAKSGGLAGGLGAYFLVIAHPAWQTWAEMFHQISLSTRVLTTTTGIAPTVRLAAYLWCQAKGSVAAARMGCGRDTTW